MKKNSKNEMRSKAKKTRSILWAFAAFLLMAFTIYTITTKGTVKAEEIDWSFSNQICEVSFLATNTADRVAECTFLFRAFDYVHTHDRKYELLGKKELIVLLGPKERKRIRDKFGILPIFKPVRSS